MSLPHILLLAALYVAIDYLIYAPNKKLTFLESLHSLFVKRPIKIIKKIFNKEKSKEKTKKKSNEELDKTNEKPIEEQFETSKDNNGRGCGYDPKLTSPKNRLPKRAYDPSVIINRQRGKTNMERTFNNIF